MMATSTELLRIVSSLDSVDFSSIKSFISQPFRYSPVFFFLFGLSSEYNMYEGIVSKKKIWRLVVSIGHFAVVGLLS